VSGTAPRTTSRCRGTLRASPTGTQTLVATVRDASGNSGSTRARSTCRRRWRRRACAAHRLVYRAGDGATVSGTVSVDMSETGAAAPPFAFTLTVDARGLRDSGSATTRVVCLEHDLRRRRRAHRSASPCRTAPVARHATRGVTVRNTRRRRRGRSASSLPSRERRPGAGVVWFTIWVDGAAAGSKTYTSARGPHAGHHDHHELRARLDPVVHYHG